MTVDMWIREEAEYAKREAMEEGLKEGRKEGLKEGRKEGREEGLKEGQNLLVSTVNRLRAGEALEEILKSGVDEETVRLAQKIC